MQKLAGKTAIVTGAGRGIGNAVARRFASEGARVILISRSPSSCGGAAEEINKEFPDSCKAYPCDVADYAAVQETMAAILKDFLQIDILVNNAGITRDSLMLRMKEEDWDAVLDTNLKSAFNTVKALQRVLMKSPAGDFMRTRWRALTVLNALFRLVSRTASQSSSFMRSIRESRVMPALFTRMSICRKSFKMAAMVS